MVWYWEGKCCNSDQTDPSHFLRPMLMGHEKPLWCSHKYEFYPCIIFLRLCWNGQSPTFTQIQVGPRWCTETSCVRAVAMQVVREGFTSSLSSMLPPLESQRRNACQTQPLWLLNCFGVSWRMNAQVEGSVSRQYLTLPNQGQPSQLPRVRGN